MATTTCPWNSYTAAWPSVDSLRVMCEDCHTATFTSSPMHSAIMLYFGEGGRKHATPPHHTPPHRKLITRSVYFISLSHIQACTHAHTHTLSKRGPYYLRQCPPTRVSEYLLKLSHVRCVSHVATRLYCIQNNVQLRKYIFMREQRMKLRSQATSYT